MALFAGDVIEEKREREKREDWNITIGFYYIFVFHISHTIIYLMDVQYTYTYGIKPMLHYVPYTSFSMFRIMLSATISRKRIKGKKL